MIAATAPAAAPSVPLPFRVLDRRLETHDVVTLTVAPVDGLPPSFEPAQFSMIGIVGLGDVPISISSGSEHEHRYTLRRAGAVTDALASVSAGDIVSVRGPFGRPWNLDRASGRHALFVAGGIGLAPLRAAIEQLTEPGAPCSGVTVLVGARSPDDLLFADWLRRLPDRECAVGLAVDADRGQLWDGAVGPVTDLLESAIGAVGHQSIAAYVCGPDPMMTATIIELGRCGVSADQVQVTLERNMQCANGWCGHCQLGPVLVCRDGPVLEASALGDTLEVAEL